MSRADFEAGFAAGIVLKNGRELERNRWYGMIQRCENPKHASFGRYGAKGIRIHPAWRASYSAFLRDVGRAPTAKHQLDRIDNTKGYEPGNVRWASPKEQAKNRSNSNKLFFAGRRWTQREFAKEIGVVRTTVERGLKKGRSPEEIARRAAAHVPGALRTHCPRGHEYTPENTVTNSVSGTRMCRECRRIQKRKTGVSR